MYDGKASIPTSLCLTRLRVLTVHTVDGMCLRVSLFCNPSSFSCVNIRFFSSYHNRLHIFAPMPARVDLMFSTIAPPRSYASGGRPAVLPWTTPYTHVQNDESYCCSGRDAKRQETKTRTERCAASSVSHIAQRELNICRTAHG